MAADSYANIYATTFGLFCFTSQLFGVNPGLSWSMKDNLFGLLVQLFICIYFNANMSQCLISLFLLSLIKQAYTVCFHHSVVIINVCIRE